MKIREIEYKDNQPMEQIIKKALEISGLDIPGTAYFDPHLGELAHYYKHQPGAKYWVVVDEADKVVGGIGIGPFGEERDVGELQKLYIAPEAQGKGLSRQLMKVALNFAKEHYTYCYIETSHKLEIANLLYDKLGFKRLDKPLDGSEHTTMDKWFIKKL